MDRRRVRAGNSGVPRLNCCRATDCNTGGLAAEGAFPGGLMPDPALTRERTKARRRFPGSSPASHPCPLLNRITLFLLVAD
jgi:hypothetical protein